MTSNASIMLFSTAWRPEVLTSPKPWSILYTHYTTNASNVIFPRSNTLNPLIIILLVSECVSACPCFIARSWWMAGLISDGLGCQAEVRDTRPQNNRDVLSSAPAPARQTQTPHGGWSPPGDVWTPGRGAREIEFFIIDKWLCGPGRRLLSVWSRYIYIEMKNVYSECL